MRITLASPSLLVFMVACHSTAHSNLPIPDQAQMRGHVAELAADDYAGRFTFDAGGARTVDYLADYYRSRGIAPVDEEHAVPFVVTGTRERRCDSLSFTGPERQPAITADDYTPLTFSGDGEVDGELVFVGYAAQSHPDAQYRRVYDSLADVDLHGKIAVVLLGRPQDPWLRFERTERIALGFAAEAAELAGRGDVEGMGAAQARARLRMVELVESDLGAPLPDDVRASMLAVELPTARQLHPHRVLAPARSALEAIGADLREDEHTPRRKAERLAARGAVGVVFVNGPASFLDDPALEADALPDIRIQPGLARLDIPVVQVRSAVASELLAGLGVDLEHEQAELDAWHGPRSTPLAGRATLHVDMAPLMQRTDNVLAMIPGGDLADEVVILGAHWDHIGTTDNELCIPLVGDDGELDTICNGADDNASGTAMVLAVAQAIIDSGIVPRRTIVFAHFAGEEIGLLGSQALVRSWPNQLGEVHSMINLDMVGRLSSVGLIIGGTATSSSWSGLIADAGYEGGPVCLEGTSSSDQETFAELGVPSLSLYTLAHGDYHMPSDEYEHINFEGMSAIAQTVLSLLVVLADGAELGPELARSSYAVDCPQLHDHQPGTFRVDGLAPPPLKSPGLRVDLR
jgi:Peptidase family M28